MNKIVSYIILHEIYVSDLEKKVMDYIRNGWQPLGGVCFVKGGFEDQYTQAIVQYRVK